MAPPMSPHAQRHRRDQPLCSSPQPALRVAAAGRWIRSGPGPPELVPPRPPVPATPTETPRTSMVTWGGRPSDARPQTIAMVLECGWIPPGRLVLGASRRALVTPGVRSVSRIVAGLVNSGNPLGDPGARRHGERSGTGPGVRGSKKSATAVTCVDRGSRRWEMIAHCVPTPDLPDLHPASQLAVALRSFIGSQGRGVARLAPRGRRASQNDPQNRGWTGPTGQSYPHSSDCCPRHSADTAWLHQAPSCAGTVAWSPTSGPIRTDPGARPSPTPSPH
jgi:hypothetical protein